MTTTQRVDVERLTELLANALQGVTAHASGCVSYPPETAHLSVSFLAKHGAALLQQLAEAERARDIYKAADESMQEAHSQALNKLAERDAEIERLKGVIAWVGQVYPATDAEADGAHMTVTWAQFNAMREAAGFQPAKAATQARDKSLIVRADYLRSLEAAERDREEATELLREVHRNGWGQLTISDLGKAPLLERIAALLAANGGQDHG